MTAPTEPHLLMTADAVGGVWTYASDLMRRLTGQGWRVTLAVLGPAPSDGQLALLQQSGADTADVISIDANPEWLCDSPVEAARAGALVRDLARHREVDLVHLNDPALVPSAVWPCPVLAVAHSCVASWFDAVRAGEALPRDLAWRRNLTALGINSADRVVAPSASFARTLQALYTPRVRIEAILNGRSPAQRSETPSLGPSDRVLAAGRLWDEAKNVAVLDEAARRQGLFIDIAGPLRGPIGGEARFASLNALGNLSPDAMRAVLATRPVFVAPALYEPFGLGVLEAAQAGCPLVLSRIPSFEELWSGAAVFVNPRDPEDVGAAITALLRHPLRRERLGQLAQARAVRYSADAMAIRYLALYRELLAGGIRRDYRGRS